MPSNLACGVPSARSDQVSSDPRDAVNRYRPSAVTAPATAAPGRVSRGLRRRDAMSQTSVSPSRLKQTSDSPSGSSTAPPDLGARRDQLLRFRAVERRSNDVCLGRADHVAPIGREGDPACVQLELTLNRASLEVQDAGPVVAAGDKAAAVVRHPERIEGIDVAVPHALEASANNHHDIGAGKRRITCLCRSFALRRACAAVAWEHTARTG